MASSRNDEMVQRLNLIIFPIEVDEISDSNFDK